MADLPFRSLRYNGVTMLLTESIVLRQPHYRHARMAEAFDTPAVLNRGTPGAAIRP